LATALVAALLHRRDGQPLEKESVRDAALKIETLFHGKTSGIDVEVSTYGGTRAFLNGHSEPIPDPAREYHLLLVDTGIPRDSKTMISRAKQSMADMQDAERHSMLANLESIVNRLRGRSIRLEEAMGPFQVFLERLGVGHPAITGFIGVAKDKLGITSKITGAGGGGCLYALVPKTLDPQETIKALKVALEEDLRTNPYTYSISIVKNTDIGVQIIPSDSSSIYIHN
jgi:mevalonate kinase